MAKEINKFRIWNNEGIDPVPFRYWLATPPVIGYNREATPGYNIKSKNSFPSNESGFFKEVVVSDLFQPYTVDKHGIKLAARQNVLELISYLK